MNILLQHWTGELDELGQRSTANMEAYAQRVGAEYALLRGNLFRPDLHPACQKLQMLDAVFDFYEWVVMVDMDMFAVTGLAENVFEAEGTGLFSDYTASIFSVCRRQHPTLTDERYGYWGGAIWRLHRDRRRQLRAHLREDEMAVFSGNFNDEGIMHRLATLAKIPQDRMDQRWCQCSYLPNPEQAAMIHVRTKVTPKGPKRTKLENYHALAGVIE